jgi:hypothetical protein
MFKGELGIIEDERGINPDCHVVSYNRKRGGRLWEAGVRLCWRETRHMLDRGTLPVSAGLNQPVTLRAGPKAPGGSVCRVAMEAANNLTHFRSKEKEKNKRRKMNGETQRELEKLPKITKKDSDTGSRTPGC